MDCTCRESYGCIKEKETAGVSECKCRGNNESAVICDTVTNEIGLNYQWLSGNVAHLLDLVFINRWRSCIRISYP